MSRSDSTVSPTSCRKTSPKRRRSRCAATLRAPSLEPSASAAARYDPASAVRKGFRCSNRRPCPRASYSRRRRSRARSSSSRLQRQHGHACAALGRPLAVIFVGQELDRIPVGLAQALPGLPWRRALLLPGRQHQRPGRGWKAQRFDDHTGSEKRAVPPPRASRGVGCPAASVDSPQR